MNTKDPKNIPAMADALASMMPGRTDTAGVVPPSQPQSASSSPAAAAADMVRKASAAEFAKRRYAERIKAAKAQKELDDASAAGVDPSLDPERTAKAQQAKAEAKARLEALDELQEADSTVINMARYAAEAGLPASSEFKATYKPASPASPASPTPSPAKVSVSPNAASAALAMQGTTRPEVARLLTSLGVNLSVQLSKNDTANLLAVLLTCNETQLLALYDNPRIPVAIRTIIKRILDDSKTGSMAAIERIWDRVFGKAPLRMDLPEQTQLQTGILPNTPISREAYIVIRDTLLK